MEELLNKALLVQKQTKKYSFANATVIAISTILFFDYGALAGSYRQDSKMPKCQNNLGEAVVFINGNSDKQKPAAGMAKRDENGQPIVVRFNYESAPVELQQFIDFHECAHHQTGDLEQPHPPQNSPKHMMKESIADCIAALRMRKSEEILLIEALLELKKAMSALGFPLTSIKSRELNISNCFKNKISTKLYISKVLKKRGFE